MKTKSILYFLLFLFAMGIYACQEESFLHPSQTWIHMEGEGGNTTISMNTSDFIILGIIYKRANETGHIYGETYSLEGELISKNKQLYLEGLGRLQSLWDDKGFTIIRESLSELKIIMEENYTIEDFHIAIIIEGGNEQKEINIIQKKFLGYRFEKIEYFVKEDDYSYLYFDKGTRYKFFLDEETEFLFSPFAGVWTDTKSYFQSDDRGAFLGIDSMYVKVPSEIYNNTIYYYGDSTLYDKFIYTRPCKIEDKAETVILSGQNTPFYLQVYLEYYNCQVSYIMTLINNRTNDKKEIEGKWIERALTGNYYFTIEED